MKSVAKEFAQKIISGQGILDTKDYRYVYVDANTVKRLPLSYIGTTAAIGAEWEELKIRA